MQLIGMLDSPYVRRVAISLQLLNLPFEHRSVSVFRQFDEFHRINAVVKAPTLVCDDGGVLMDSTLILDYAESLAAARGTTGRSLLPKDPAERLRVLRLTGLALAACEKSVQIIYEHNLRPAEKQHAPWLARVHGQLGAARASAAGLHERGNRSGWRHVRRGLAFHPRIANRVRCRRPGGLSVAAGTFAARRSAA